MKYLSRIPSVSDRFLRSLLAVTTMQNDEGKNVDLYIPRKCTATNRVIRAKDHASVQINIGHVDASGVYTSEYTTVAFAGYLRAKGEGDAALNRLVFGLSLFSAVVTHVAFCGLDLSSSFRFFRIAASQNLMKDINSFRLEHKFKSNDE